MSNEDLTQRIQQLSQSVLDKEREIVASHASQTFLKQDLEAVQAELTAAREELRNEATKNSLLEQRLKRVSEELQQARSDLSSANSERDTLNRTLGRVHDQLSGLKNECAAKGLQVTELQLHYDGLLAAKEESILSLQALLDGQAKQLRDQQALWEEQKRSLKASLADASERANAAQLAQVQATGSAAQAAALADLRAKLSLAEKAAVKAAEREAKLVELVRHRERQLAKLKSKRSQNSQGRNGNRDSTDRSQGVVLRDHVADRVGEDAYGGGGVVRFAERLLGGAGGCYSSDESACGDTATSADTGAVAAASPLRRSVAVAQREGASNPRSAAALQEERRRHEAARTRLAAAEREADDLRVQVSRLRTELAEAVSGTVGGGSVQLADELLRAHRKIQDLESQLRRAREGAVAAAAEAAAAAGAGASAVGSGARAAAGPGLLTSVEHLAIVRQRLLRQRQEFEQLLGRVVAGEPGLVRGAAGGVLLPEDVKALMDKHLSRVDTLASMSALPEARRGGDGAGDPDGGGAGGGGQPRHQHQHQHSLFVVRAAWSTLRRALMSLQEAVAASLDVSANPAVAYLQSADFLSRLMREWAVGEKKALDAAVEASTSAAVALVQEAAARLQAHALDVGVTRQQLQEAQDEVAQLRLANSMVQAEGERRLAEARVEVEEMRRQVDAARLEVSAIQREASARSGELDAARARAEAAEAAVRRAEAAAAAADVDRTRLRKNLAMLEGDKGHAEAAVMSREEERLRLSRALSDANATIALLHDRLDAMQATGSSELTALKAKIRDVVTALESPSLPQLHAMMVAAAAEGGEGAGSAGDDDGPPPAGVRSTTTTPRRGARRGGPPGMLTGLPGVMTESALNSLALGLQGLNLSTDDPVAVSSSLVSALDAAATSCSAALHRMALLELAHHEVDRGVGAVGAVRAHLASATTEMAAGRVAFGDVLLTELLSMLDDGACGGAGPAPAPSPSRGVAVAPPPHTPRARSASSGHWQVAAAGPGGGAAGGGGGAGPLCLRSQMAVARDQTQHLMRHLKNMEGMLLALKSALPEWLELATARLAARHRTDLSRLRGVLGGQLASLRRDLREMKAACAASLADAALQAEETLQQARRMASTADLDRTEAAAQVQLLTKDLRAVTDLLAATAATTAAISSGSDPSMASATAAAGGAAASPMASTAAAPAAAAAASVSSGGGENGGAGTRAPAAAEPAPGSLSYSLVRAITAAARAVPELRAGCDRIRRDAMGLVAERDKARTIAGAAAAHAALVVRSVAEAVPLPEVLVLALLNQTAAPEPGMAALWCSKLRECLSAQVAAAQAVAAEAVVKGQVEPLRRDVDRLAEELRVAKRRVAALQAQASRFLAESGSALESCRRAAGEAAAAVLDSVMSGVREEVAAVRMQVSDLEEASSEVLRQANAAWAEQLTAVRASSSAAVAALEDSVAVLQTQLGTEADAYDALKGESDAAAQEAAERAATEEQRARALSAELAAARDRLAVLEAAETTLEGENRGLRKALRQRDMLAMGLMQQQQQDEEGRSQGQRPAGSRTGPRDGAAA